MAVSQLNLNLVLTGAVSGATVGSSGSISVPTVFDLRGVISPNESHIYQTLGYWSIADGGESLYYWDANDSVTADNGSTVIAVTGVASGRLKLLPLNGEVSVKQFGAIGDGTSRGLTSSFQGQTRFASLGAAVTAVGTGLGTWFELLSTSDTLDSIGIQSALSYAISGGLMVRFPQGEYQTARGLWIGQYTHGEYGVPGVVDWHKKSGFKLYGDGSTPRQQADGDMGVGIHCETDIANRWTIKIANTGTIPTTGFFALRLWWGNGQTASGIRYNTSPTALKNALEALTDVGTGMVTVSSPTGGNLASGCTYIITFARNLPTGTKSYHGEIKIDSSSLNNNCWPVIYFDGGILNLRGQSEHHVEIENIALSSKWVSIADTQYYASCGLNLAHSTMNGHRFTNVRSFSCRWGIIHHENDGGNGESHIFDKFIASGGYGYLYFSGGQAFNNHHIYWECGSDGPIESGDSSERVFVQFAPSTIQGFSLDFLYGETRFYDDAFKKHTVLKIGGVGVNGNSPQMYGVINFIGTRTEHVTTLVNADFGGSWNHTGTINFYGHDFTCRGSVASGHALIDDLNIGPSSEYRINIENSVFTPYDVHQDIFINMGPVPKNEVVFRNCTFTDWRSRKVTGGLVKFIDCRWSDHSLSANGMIRPWNQIYDTKPVLYSRFNQDVTNPWMWSGASMNGLNNCEWVGVTPGSSFAPSGWELRDISGTAGQRFTDCGLNLQGKSWTQFGTWGKSALAFQIASGYSLTQSVSSYMSSGSSSSYLSMGYRAKTAVPSGSVEFRLESSMTGRIFDSVTLSDTGYQGGPIIVDLQVSNNVMSAGDFPVLRIKALNSLATVQMWWQHAYRIGGGPTVFKYTTDPPVSDHWDAVVSTVRVLDRMVVPSTPFAQVQGAGYPLGSGVAVAGEVYYDPTIDRLLFFSGSNIWKPVGDSTVTVTGMTSGGFIYTLSSSQALAQTIVASTMTPVATGLVVPNLVRQWTIVNSTPSGLMLKTDTQVGGVSIGVGKTAIVRCDGNNTVSRVTSDV